MIAGSDAGEAAELRLVPTGAKCGEEMVRAVPGPCRAGQGGHRPRDSLRASPACPQVCYAGRCQNLLVYGDKNCSAKCNNHGVGAGMAPPGAAAGRPPP